MTAAGGERAHLLARVRPVPARTRSAVICEDPDDVAAFANYVPSSKKVPSGQFLWQAYLVSGLEATSCSNS